MKESILLLHNIRSVYNVGAIFRTVDAIGISKILLSGYTPQPIDRFGRKRNDFHKCALGAEDFVEWESISDYTTTLREFKNKGFQIIGLEQTKNSVDYKKVKLKDKVVIILGSEAGGMEKELLDECEIVSDIPMKGKKDSLNVSVATGIFLYGLFDR